MSNPPVLSQTASSSYDVDRVVRSTQYLPGPTRPPSLVCPFRVPDQVGGPMYILCWRESAFLLLRWCATANDELAHEQEACRGATDEAANEAVDEAVDEVVAGMPVLVRIVSGSAFRGVARRGTLARGPGRNCSKLRRVAFMLNYGTRVGGEQER